MRVQITTQIEKMILESIQQNGCHLTTVKRIYTSRRIMGYPELISAVEMYSIYQKVLELDLESCDTTNLGTMLPKIQKLFEILASGKKNSNVIDVDKTVLTNIENQVIETLSAAGAQINAASKPAVGSKIEFKAEPAKPQAEQAQTISQNFLLGYLEPLRRHTENVTSKTSSNQARVTVLQEISRILVVCCGKENATLQDLQDTMVNVIMRNYPLVKPELTEEDNALLFTMNDTIMTARDSEKQDYVGQRMFQPASSSEKIQLTPSSSSTP